MAMSQPYQKPQQRKGMVCHWCRWNIDGTIREARYRPIREAKAEAAVGDDPPSSTIRRGLVKLDQARLL